ncbi:MAG: hypothetical protein ACFFA8_05370 [Promethearchaeota archaeon]
MVIKIKKSIISLIIVLLFGTLLISFYKLPTINGSLFEFDNPTLIDKVYTFLSPEDELVFPEIFMEKDFTYYFWIEVVSPHNCTLNISLWDPDTMRYNIFHAVLTQGDWHEIPFGTALQGIYAIRFNVISINNLNIYIRLEKGEQCLTDKIPSQLFNREVFYRIARFSDETSFSYYINFDTDVSYRCYIGRVSSISVLDDSEVSLDYFIYEPNDIQFKIYFNTTLPTINELIFFNFGTAKSGVYVLNITISCNIDAVNIGYAICWDYRISDPTNNSGSPSDNDTNFTQFFSLPSEMMTGMVIIAGVFIGTLILLTMTRKRKNV